VLTGDNSTSVTFSKSAGAGTVSGLGSATAANGVATKTVTGVLTASITLTAHSGSLTDDTTTFVVAAGAADHLTITSATTNFSSGATRAITAEIRDANGNLLTGDNSTSVTFSKTAGGRHRQWLGAATAVNGVATKTVTGILTGSITLTAHTGTLTDDTTTFTVVAGAADHLTITSAASNLSSSSTRDITAEIRDANDNLLTGDSSTSVTFRRRAVAAPSPVSAPPPPPTASRPRPSPASLAGSITLTAHTGSLTDDTSSFTLVARLQPTTS